MNDALKQILELVETKAISPEDGQRRLAALRASPVAEPPASSTPADSTPAEPTGPASRKVAVIGFDCRFGSANSPAELWHLLAAGESAVTEVPADRWRVEDYFDPDPSTPGRTNSRWGGFLDDIAGFDPLFFQLSGREAERMDPQQRLFLETCWNAMENAGYAGDALSGTHCGVFAGTPASDYCVEADSGEDADAQLLLGNDTAILPARISYLLDLRGPSIALNTACSSALVAVDLARRSIVDGQCELALAGGVCLFVGPGFYLSASKGGMLSPRGRCSAFDQSADGFVPGEGCGVVVLKDLDAALRDGDRIRGVLLGSETNQDGKSNGITAPSARAQTRLQLETYRRAGVDPRTIELVEAHGTGTALGDPIEVDALTRSFAEYTEDRQFCAIGSIKTNLGHTGQAAGIAGLIKCLLAFEHDLIPATLHLSTPNERIPFADTPFYPATQPVPWPRREGSPRRAAVSSFGYSGTNAHLVVEEPPPSVASVPDDRARLVLISARTRSALGDRLTQLADWLADPPHDCDLRDLAFTLCAGRKHFEFRAAIVARSVDELRAALRYRAMDLSGGWSKPAPLGDTEREQAIADLNRQLDAGSVAEGALETAARHYERGLTLPPSLLFPDGGRRTPLPTYPFERDRYWYTEPAPPRLVEIPAPEGHRYLFRPLPADPLVAGHVFAGRPILAATVSIELARGAARLAGYGTAHRIEQVSWRRPVPSTDEAGVEIRLSPEGATTIRFALDTPDGFAGEPGVSGILRLTPANSVPAAADLAVVRARCSDTLESAECYRRFAALGFAYGPEFRVVRELRFGTDEVLARLALPAAETMPLDEDSLRPTLLDGALQALVALADGDEDTVPRVPCAVERMEVHAPPRDACHAHLVRRADGVLDIQVTDDAGSPLITMHGLATAEAPPSIALPDVRPNRETADRETADTTWYVPRWRATARPAAADGPVLVLDSDACVAEDLRRRHPEATVVLAVPGAEFRQHGAGDYEIRPGSVDDHRRLLAGVPASSGPLRIVVRWAATPAGQEAGQGFSDAVERGFGALLALSQALCAARTAGPVAVRVVYPLTDGAAPPELAALGAFARTVRLENADLCVQAVGLPFGDPARFDGAWDVLLAAPSATEPVELRMSDEGTLVRRTWAAVDPPAAVPAVRPGGVYVITGGTGHLGQAVADHITAQGGRPVLISRTAPESPAAAHEQADVSDDAALDRALRAVRERFGPPQGIIHAAGVVRDSSLVHKTAAEADEVLRAKVHGAVNLDRLTRADPLDFVVLFSSVVAAVGNPGQCDYAFANGFLDEFARMREARRRAGQGQGKTVSIAWPAWGGGSGMAAGNDRGADALGVAEGLAAFDRALAAEEPHVVLVKGAAAIRAIEAVTDSAVDTATTREAAAVSSAEFVARLTAILADELRLPAARIEADTPFSALGIDSVNVLRLNELLEREFGPVPKTVFFQNSNVAELADHLAARSAATPPAPAVTVTSTAGHAAAAPVAAAHGRDSQDIAVIGLAGRYPMAADVEEFWRNLVEGRDCITTIPADRWPLDGFYDPEGGPGRSYAKWGGFLADVDRFDPLFFNIAPHDADMMDPQERVFLETVWLALEDAGYTRAELGRTSTGVFAGVMYGDYQRYGSAADGRMAVSSHASVANRASYFFDFRGPSIALDTMCSSSLTAIHLACESLRSGDCGTAVAGGVNLSVHPDKYRQLSLGRFLSTDGRCRSFGAGGDGYVPGEGVGALVLKPLAAAVADGDTVHAVIAGSAVNHGGRTNGYTVPNTNAQTSAVLVALRRAGVDPADLDYIEAHGTGTVLGDPIEIAALTDALASSDSIEPGRTIPVGSVKSAIGHLESAAGIAAVTKVILQMRHRKLVPSLHADELNPLIDLGSSLAVQRDLAEWTPRGGRSRLVAGISSFGAGGSNAHLVLREPPPVSPVPADDHTGGTQVVVVSAKNRDRLVELAGKLAERLARWCSSGSVDDLVAIVARYLADRLAELLGVGHGDITVTDDLGECGMDEVTRARLGAVVSTDCDLPADELPSAADTATELALHLVRQHETALRACFGGPADTAAEAAPALADIAYTLQLGREPMDERLAMVVDDLPSAVTGLRAFAEGGLADGVHTGSVTDDRDEPIDVGDPTAVAVGWVRGATVDWPAVHAGHRRRRVRLAGYPFARERHWLDPVTTAAGPQPSPRQPEVTMTGQPDQGPVDSGDDTRSWLSETLTGFAAETIGLEPERLNARTPLGEFGFESVSLVTLAGRISDLLGVAVSPTLFYERRGVAGIVDWLLETHPEVVAAHRPVPADPVGSVATEPPTRTGGVEQAGRTPLPVRTAEVGDSGAEPVAIIGMSGRFPGSPDLDRYWDNLYHRRDLITEVPADRWDWRVAAGGDVASDEPSPYRWGGFIEGTDLFDPLFFGISPAEAEMMDPQQRMLLQMVWAAVEDSGYRPSALAGRQVGLFCGIQFSDYRQLMQEVGLLSAQSGLGNEHSIAVNRISYLLDLHGPSEPVNTACSSSLVAVHRAVASLRRGESELAVAGGISLNLGPDSTTAAALMGLLSPDGRCMTLDSRANGYVKGEGVGLVVLKPLSRALSDGDQVHAVIRGTAVNHGGRATSLTAPNAEAQAALLRTAVAEAGVGPETIGYLELHGTGTQLGDPVEVNGIRSAFRQLTGNRAATVAPHCGIGSVKTNIGHLEPASGIAGLLKLVLAMRHETLPGMVHLRETNPYVDLADSPFHIVEDTVEWQRTLDADRNALPLRGGVSSFGFGGVNAHVLIEEPPLRRPVRREPPVERERLFVFSARNTDALVRTAARYVERLEHWEGHPEDGQDPDVVAATLWEGREPMAERLAVVAADLATLRERLTAVAAGDWSGPGVRRGRAEEPGAASAIAQVTGGPDAMAAAWVTGRAVTWTPEVPAGRPRRTSLPTYPFEEKRYWFSVPEGAAVAPGAGAPPEQETVTGEPYIRAGLRGILRDKLKLDDDELDENRSLANLGVDSIVSAMIMQVVQEEFDIQVPLTALVDHPTLRLLSAYVHQEFFADKEIGGVLAGREPRAGRAGSEGSQNRLPAELLPISVGGSGQPSFWVHGATGYSTWFQNLSQALGPAYPLYAFQAKGTDGRSMPHSLEEMVAHYLDCIRRVQPHGPYFIGGYSFGGLIATQMAQQLHDEGEEIRHLVLFDTYPATQEVFDRHHETYDRDFLQMYLTNYFLKLDEHPERVIREEDVAHLPLTLQVVELARLAKERTDRRMAAEDIYLYLRGGLVCSEQAEGIYQQYKMVDYTASDVTFFKAMDGFTGKASSLYWRPSRILDGYDYETPWRESVTGDFQLVELDVDHLNQLEEPTLSIASRRIEAVLKQPPSLDEIAYTEFNKDFEAVTEFGNRLLADVFRDAVASTEASARTEIRDRLAVVPGYGRLFQASCDILERERYVQRLDDGRLAATEKLNGAGFPGGAEEIAATAADLAAKHPSIAEYLPLLTACQAEVLAVLAGQRDATDVIFPGGSMELVAEIYKGGIQSDYYNHLVADVVEEHVRHFARRYRRSRAKIFEVGAGTGGTSTFVFDALADYAEKVWYSFTDIGGAFLQLAERQFGADHPYLDFGTHDVEREPETQGYEPYSMDVVIAANVLHTTRRIDVTVRNCRRLLKPGGILVINELTQRLDYNTLTFGLTEGWWIYQDDAVRIPGSPLLDARGWRDALGQAGFGEVTVHGVAGVDEDDQAQCVIVAKVPDQKV
ncbi:MAG: SDR family NAD(P)-dependent oxidoreductase [Actinophytocola sp.]|uniref:SDR family NAD(P)-dependent oxidoreductase n=1 Tax=Actinophytocola sp. TaxID=1872138 RepID=UPI0013295E62|nr:SDR family NAD(P)-dependent oxidoreductase [Actinophytocola sp.]MPZ78879.1 SDR family NAD(P)-dependent oxidoreductase [Actinophytocola sp.]